MKKQPNLMSFFKKASAPLPTQEENAEVNIQENVEGNVQVQNQLADEPNSELFELPVVDLNADPKPATSGELDLFERGKLCKKVISFINFCKFLDALVHFFMQASLHIINFRIRCIPLEKIKKKSVAFILNGWKNSVGSSIQNQKMPPFVDFAPNSQ